MDHEVCKDCSIRFCTVCGIAENAKEDAAKKRKQKEQIMEDYKRILVITLVPLSILFFTLKVYYGWDVKGYSVFFIGCLGGFLGLKYFKKFKKWYLFTSIPIVLTVLYTAYPVYEWFEIVDEWTMMWTCVLVLGVIALGYKR